MDEEELQEYRSFAESVHDELTSELFPASLVQGAREEECALMEKLSVCEEVSLSACCAGGDHVRRTRVLCSNSSARGPQACAEPCGDWDRQP